jgi:nucleoside-diphosphate-sugar epimerase
MIAAGLGRKRLLCVPTPKFCVRAAGLLGELAGQIVRRPLSLNRDKAREATAGSWICSPRSAEKELGFRPLASLRERIRQTCQWYLQEGWL